MKIAYTLGAGRGETDLLLASFAEMLIGAGKTPLGTVQINSECAEPGKCDMDVKVLPDGPTIRISQSLGPSARGCRLDPAALEMAVGQVAAGLSSGADCVIVNKFGKHEASGGGFRPVIAEALALDVPVVVGLSRLNTEAFLSFTGGMAQEVAPDLDSLKAWYFETPTPAI